MAHGDNFLLILAANSMIKSELVDRLHEQNRHLHRQQVERIVSGILNAIADALISGRRVELREFGILV